MQTGLKILAARLLTYRRVWASLGRANGTTSPIEAQEIVKPLSCFSVYIVAEKMDAKEKKKKK